MAREGLAVCAVFRDEAPYLLEWIAYHHAAGAAHFVLYDNASTDGGAKLIAACPLASFVTIVSWPERPPLLSAYRHFLDNVASRFEWAAFIDIDEFLLPVSGSVVPPLLARLQQGVSAVLVNWRIFGPSGHEEPPPGLVTENYTRRLPDDAAVNRHVKSIVRCADVLGAGINPHEFALRGAAANSRGEVVPNVALQPHACHEVLVLNHYFTRSRRDWRAKVARGSAMYPGPKYDVAVAGQIEAQCTVTDTAIHRFLPAVRERLSNPVPQSPSAPPDAWEARGEDCFMNPDGMVVRDRSRPGAPWLAALRGPGRPTDPWFLSDGLGRIRSFASAAAARAACATARRH
jgi:hypothetical protein